MSKRLLGELELNRIYQRDCIDGMRMIPGKSVDLIVIDPPYNIGKDKRWDKWKTVDEYVAFMSGVFKECERVLKPNGSFYWFHNDMTQIRKLMDAMDETGFVYKQLITWNKIDPSFKNYGYVQQRLSIDMMRNYYNGFTEYCVYYTFQDETGLEKIIDEHIKPLHPFAKYLVEEFKRAGVTRKEIAALFPSRTGGLTGCVSNWLNGDNVITEDQYLKIRDYLNGEYLRKEYEDLRNEYEDLRKEYESHRYSFNVATVKDDLRANSNVWLYPPAKNLGHITPKPVELIENIIRHSSNEGDIVLDCFMGSGTTAVASTRLNRNFIGFEREPEYIEIANKRIDNELEGA